MSDVWKHCVEVLRRELTSQQFNTWILPLQAEEHGDRLYVLAPNRFVLDWVRGRFAPQIEEQARAALERFIPARVARGDRTVLVITGKGIKKTGYLQLEQKGVLRSMVPVWLNAKDLAPMVAGIDPAHQSQGGGGALYVRLKRKREK